jgi:hypothetical protein
MTSTRIKKGDFPCINSSTLGERHVSVLGMCLYSTIIQPQQFPALHGVSWIHTTTGVTFVTQTLLCSVLLRLTFRKLNVLVRVLYEGVSKIFRTDAVKIINLTTKSFWILPTSTQLLATWHTDSLDTVVLPSTGASRYNNCCIDGGTSPEYFGYTLVQHGHYLTTTHTMDSLLTNFFTLCNWQSENYQHYQI